MATDSPATAIRVTIDEIGPNQDNIQLATLVSDYDHILTVPVDLLPDGARVGDVLTVSFQPDPDVREERKQYISELQRRLFGSG